MKSLPAVMEIFVKEKDEPPIINMKDKHFRNNYLCKTNGRTTTFDKANN